MMDFNTLALECAPSVHVHTMAAIVRVESSFNPYAIGVVGGRLERQPQNKAEAIATAKSLEQAGWNFSVGVGQVNRYNLPKYGMDYDTAFEPCQSLRAGSSILKDCYDRALLKTSDSQQALHMAFSCYYSGNFKTGFKPDFKNQPSYVDKILASAGVVEKAIPVVPGPGKPSQVPNTKQGAAKSAPATQSNDAPVMLQAIKKTPKKPRNIPAQYDGFSTEADDEDAIDGFTSENGK